MIYRILRQLAGLAFVIYFRKIYLIDAHHVPKSGPVLLACNHPSAFLEACVLSCFLPRHLHYLTRGDFFTSKIARWFLAATHQIPIYRTRDGFKNLRNNKETFEECYARLADGKVILLFPESQTILQKRLRPIQRGAARICFGTMEKFPGVSPVIVPVGVTFAEPRKLGGDAYFRFSEPIVVGDQMELYQSTPQEALKSVTIALEEALRPLIVDIADEQREKIYDVLADVVEEQPVPFPIVSNSSGALDRQMDLAAVLNELPKSEIDSLESQLNQLEKFGSHWKEGALELLGDSTRFALGTTPYLLGRLINLPVTLFMKWFIERFVRVETFQGPMNAVIGFLVQGMYYIVIIALLYAMIGAPGLLLGLLVAMIGYFSIANSRVSKQLRMWRWRLTSEKMRHQIKQDLGPIIDVIRSVRN